MIIKKMINKLHKIRYQKIFTSLLYLFLFAVIIYTFYIYWFVGESVNFEIYNKTLDTLTMLLGITGGMKVTEIVTDAAKAIAGAKEAEEVTEDMRGGE